MAEEHTMSVSEQKKEDWMNSKWRPMMGWMYMTVCACDFLLFPILWSLHQAINHGQVSSQWQPLTLQGAGLFHIAMGAVLGLAAYGRTQEKLAGANNGGIQASTSGFSSWTATPSAPPTSGFANSSFPATPTTSFGNAPLGGNSASSFTPAAAATPAVNAYGAKVIPTFTQPEL